MVNWWFGLVVWDFLWVPLRITIPFIRGSQESQTTNLPLVEFWLWLGQPPPLAYSSPPKWGLNKGLIHRWFPSCVLKFPCKFPAKSEVANEVAAGEFCEATLGIQVILGDKTCLDAMLVGMPWFGGKIEKLKMATWDFKNVLFVFFWSF